MNNKVFGLIGFPLKNSFSKDYFNKKFATLNLPYIYKNFEHSTIEDITQLLKAEPNLKGLNITIPYKEKVLKYLDEIDNAALQIGAVNCVKISNGKLKGYNTDVIGFSQSFVGWAEPALKNTSKALILGRGGAAKAVAFALKQLKVECTFVSRNGSLTYNNLNEDIISSHNIIINCTPVGMYPNIDDCLNLPYNKLTTKHYCYDLIYLPEETLFLKKAKQQGAKTKNGLEMLHLQAEAAWNIWNEK
ncbi:MAG: shikimate dehydrogenase family protein [Bacteroidia bacterium]